MPEAGLDPLFVACSLFRRRKFQECANACTEMLEKNPYDQAAWSLKTRALTEQVYVDDIEADEVGIADSILDDNQIAQVVRPGTSLRTPGTAHGGTSQAMRPVTTSGRPLSGVVRPSTQSRPGTMEQAIRTARTSHTARPITSGSGRFIRLGTASILSSPDGPFINLAHLNLAKYAAQPFLAKPLFEYIYYHENDVRTALNFAAQATQANKFKDWWWKVQLGKCYYRLGLFRDAEKQFKSALKNQQMVETFLRLAMVYICLDQPVAALDVYKQGLEKFSTDTNLFTGMARIYEGLNDFDLAGKYYKNILQHDATHLEAIACIATHHFYSDQPELALRYYRRLLQMGVCNAELFNNLGLCCFYSQQYDLTLACFERALTLASDDDVAELWYNIGHIALGIGDINLAYQCFRLTLVHNAEHAEAFNNLGVIEWKKGHIEQAKSFFVTATSLASHIFEPHYNSAALSEKSSFVAVQKALDAFPEHSDSKVLLKQLKKHFSTL